MKAKIGYLWSFCVYITDKAKSSDDDYVEAIVCQESDIQENE
jgi:hypothetical protein